MVFILMSVQTNRERKYCYHHLLGGIIISDLRMKRPISWLPTYCSSFSQSISWDILVKTQLVPVGTNYCNQYILPDKLLSCKDR